MNERFPAMLSASALVLQAIAAGAVVLLYSAAYGPEPGVREPTAVVWSYVMLGMAGFVGGPLALAGGYLAMARMRSRLAVALVMLATLLATVIAVVAGYGMLVLLSLM